MKRAARLLAAAVILICLGIVVYPRGAASLLPHIFPGVVVHLPGPARQVALTFDDGPHPTATPALLSALDAAGVCGTFFVLGENATKYTELLGQILADGHSLGAHFWQDEVTFLKSAPQVAASLTRSLAALPDGQRGLVRPGYGLPNGAVMRQAKAQGVQVISGDIPAFDTLGLPNPVYRAYLHLVIRPGAIVTFHSGAHRGPRSANRAFGHGAARQRVSLCPAGAGRTGRALRRLTPLECIAVVNLG